MRKSIRKAKSYVLEPVASRVKTSAPKSVAPKNVEFVCFDKKSNFAQLPDEANKNKFANELLRF